MSTPLSLNIDRFYDIIAQKEKIFYKFKKVGGRGDSLNRECMNKNKIF